MPDSFTAGCAFVSPKMEGDRRAIAPWETGRVLGGKDKSGDNYCYVSPGIATEIFELAFYRMIFRKDNLKLLKVGDKPTMEEENEQYKRMIHLMIVDLTEIFALTDWAGAIQ